jgi:drug/metabolite transporter (DMT)-like permease
MDPVTPRERVKELMLPWAGQIGAGVGWALTHQLGSNLAFDRCQVMSPLTAVLILLLGVGLAGGGAFLAHIVWRRDEAESEPRRFLALVGMGMAALFSAALLWQTLSSFIIPRCYG